MKEQILNGEIEGVMFDIQVVNALATPAEAEEERDVAPQIFPCHDTLSDRVQKTLYYGKLPPTDRPSFSLTKLAVEEFAEVGLQKLARLDMSRAADMTRDACAGPTSLVLALIYLDRLKKQNPDYLRTVSSADLFLVSMMVASKFLHDDGEEDEVFNDEWAKSGNLDVKDFNRLEVEFLSAIDWRVNVPLVDFDAALEKIEKEIAYREITSRGWASYTDLCILSRNPQIERLFRLLTETSVKVTAVCMAAYAASIFTLLGTAAVLNQTPFGPAAVSSSFQILMSADRDNNTEPVPEPENHVTTAKLLTASLIVTTLTSSAAEEPEIDFGGEADFSATAAVRLQYPDIFSSALNRVVRGPTYGTGSAANDSDWLDPPPEWKLDRTGFIHHATAKVDSSPNSSDQVPGPLTQDLELLEEMILRELSGQWSRGVLQDIQQEEGGMQSSKYQCPLKGWGSLALMYPTQLSILV